MASSSTGAGRPAVLLFKTPVAPVETDPYQRALSEHCDPYFIPVLAEQYHTDELRTIIRISRPCEGVVITSRRGAEAWVRAAKLELEAKAQNIAAAAGAERLDWSAIPLWTVGMASVEVMNEYASKGAAERALLPSPAISGERTAKSAAALVPLLLATPPSSQPTAVDDSDAEVEDDAQNAGRPYLIIRGDKSLEEIPTALRQVGREVVELTVYSTTPRLDIAQSIEDALLKSSGRQASETTPQWLAFFSPSSASYALPLIPPDLLASDHIRFAAIGDTTRAFLIERGLTVHAVAKEPNAKALLTAIHAAGK